MNTIDIREGCWDRIKGRVHGMRVGEDPLSVFFFSVLLGEGYMENCKCYDRNGA